MSRRRLSTVILALAVLSASCGSSVPSIGAADGATLYDAYCAACHGVDGKGMPDWKTRNPDGSYPAPPHDSSGHTWHHSDDLLVDLIINGSGFAETRMPSFGDRLSEDEVLAILDYIKGWWGPEELAFQQEVSQASR